MIRRVLTFPFKMIFVIGSFIVWLPILLIVFLAGFIYEGARAFVKFVEKEYSIEIKEIKDFLKSKNMPR